MIIKKICPVCKKRTEIRSQYEWEQNIFYTYTCNHTECKPRLSAESFDDFRSIDGKKPYKFQVEGAQFVMNSQGRALIADEMALGKTVQALMVAKKLGEKFLIIGKSGLKFQWMKETHRWCSVLRPDGNEEYELDYQIQIIDNEHEALIPGMKGYVLSWDLLWRFKDIQAFINRLKVKLIILDEVQHIKSSGSKRTNGVREACKHVDYIIALSGTPIKNNAAEYFPILNILHPEKFPEKARFERAWVDSYWDGYKMKYGGIKNYESFKNYTKDFIIRRTRDEVLPDLPKIKRDYRFADLGAEVEKEYVEELKQFQNYMNFNSGGDSRQQRAANIMAYLSKMRHITGRAKVDPVISYIEDFIEETDNDRKLVVFLHHKDVASRLKNELEARRLKDAGYGKEILEIKSSMTPTERNDAVEKFWKQNYRLMLCSTLASGEGLNLQCCSDCIMLERQWNPANEEQAEARFPRPGSTASRINAVYFTAVGTIDEFFAELVERKRSYMAASLDGMEMKWDESSLIQELTEILSQSGGSKWGF